MRLFKTLFIASRPKTLVAAFCPILVGASFAYYYKPVFNGFIFTALLLTATLIQIATNYFNDAIDFEKGRDTDKRLGPSRVTAGREITASVLKKIAFFLLFIALCLGIWLAVQSSFWILLLGIPALILSYLYTGTKFSLSENGVADIFVILYFGVVPVWLTQYILSASTNTLSLVSGLQIGLLCNSLLVINNLRDLEEDKMNNKKTLVVRLGRKGGLVLLAVSLFLPYILNYFIFGTVYFRAALWTIWSFPFALFIQYKVIKNLPSKKYNMYLAFAAVHLLLFTYFFSKGILSS